MKDEFKGKTTQELVGLKSKMYSLVNVDNEETIRAKGVSKNVVRNIWHREIIDILFNKKIIRHKMKRIQSTLHKTETYDVCKMFLSCFDDKRYV